MDLCVTLRLQRMLILKWGFDLPVFENTGEVPWELLAVRTSTRL